MRMVAEGVGTTPGVLTLADRSNVDMPISQEVADVLVGTVAPADIVARLMNAKPSRNYTT